jgi:DNA-binding NarL/FixJ family response regulator
MMMFPNPPSNSEQPSPAPRLRLLLVDDMPQVLQDLQRLLELSGKVEVVGAAQDGMQAVRLAKEASPDAILMDLEMPVLDGCEATRQIKAENPSIRVVILTVHDSKEAQERARQAGADGFVIKGAHYEILLQAILSKETTFFGK